MSGRLVPFIPDGYIEYDNLSDDAKQDIVDSVGYDITEDETAVVGKKFDGNQVYVKCVDFGALPNAYEKRVAHGISTPYTIVSVTGIASNGSAEIPLPHTNPANNAYSINVYNDRTDNKVVVGTGINLSMYNAYITIEYIKANM